ncbi:MAG: hypothetical protein JWN67_4994 [Actinomycetia bacterium]|nr:hypothetical protein [Actinomycetes bacterium]
MSAFDPRTVLQGLDEPCPTCTRPLGDHTMRQWSACTTELGHHDPHHEVSEPEGQALLLAFQGRQIPMADHVSVVSAASEVRPLGMKPLYMPTIIFEFASSAGNPLVPESVTRVAYLGTAEGVRAMGRLVRDSSNAAASKAEARHRGHR